MIISPHIRELFGKHSDIMLPLLAEDPAAVAAFTDIVMGGNPLLMESYLQAHPPGDVGKLYAGHAVTMACALPSELATGEPSLNRQKWESLVIEAVNKIIRFHANQTNPSDPD
jgi:hypothetical protein